MSNLIKETIKKKRERERNEPVWDYSYWKLSGMKLCGMEDKDRV